MVPSNDGRVCWRCHGFPANWSGDRFELPGAFGCTLELRLTRGELRSESSGEGWPGCGAMVAREEGRWFARVRRLAFPFHVHIDGGLGLGTLHDVEVGSRKLPTRRVSGKWPWNGTIYVPGLRFL